MSELSLEEIEILKKLKQDYEDDQSRNSGRESHISNPDKFNFPIGMNDEGELNIVRDRNKDESE